MLCKKERRVKGEYNNDSITFYVIKEVPWKRFSFGDKQENKVNN